MQRFKNGLFLVALFATLRTHAQPADLVLAYIDNYKDLAIAEMQRTGVPASITLAQGIYESTAGTSELVMQSNNHFGIKWKPNWTGDFVLHDDDHKNEKFRKYVAAADSYKDHSDFLRNSTRYAFLFSLDPTDYSGWAYGLKKAGYATSPKYPQALVKLIEDYHLQDYTLIALGKVPSDPNGMVMSTTTSNDNNSILQAAVITGGKKAYPEIQFRINNAKVIFAKSGTSYLSIAKRYDVDLSKIFEYNEIPASDIIDHDQLISLQRKNKTGKTEFHIVTEGESLYDISQKEGIRMDCLLDLNGLKIGDRPVAGEQLNLKKKSNSTPRIASNNDLRGQLKTTN
jgi:LysM repeat protein